MTNPKDSISLNVLAGQINEHHHQACTHAQAAIDHALLAGESLLRAKAAAGHGNWRAWLSQNTEISERSAQRYMHVAKNHANLKAKVAMVADLTITGALRLLTEESVDGDELSDKEQRDFVEFMARCRRNKEELARLGEACEMATEARDIDGLKEVVRGCDRLIAEDRSCRKYAERKIRKLRRAA